MSENQTAGEPEWIHLDRQELGKYGEDLACSLLAAKGWEIIARNWRCRYGEIDIIAAQQRELAFVEVKTRRSCAAGIPLEAISVNKRRRLRKLAGLWLIDNGCSNRQICLLAVGIELRPACSPHTQIVRISA